MAVNKSAAGKRMFFIKMILESEVRRPKSEE